MRINTRIKLPCLILLFMVFLINGVGLAADNTADLKTALEKKIPLKKAFEKGIQLDSQYQNRLLDFKVAGLDERKARMKRLFRVDFSGYYLYKSQQMEISFPSSSPAPGVEIPGANVVAGSKHNYDLNLSLVQPIFSGNILSNTVKMETQKQLRESYNSAWREIEVVGAIKSSYFTYQLLENKKKSLALLVENLQLHLKKISDFYNEALVKKSDLLETEIKLSETRMSLEELAQLLEEEKINFAKLCGFAIEDIEKGYDESSGTFQESLSFFKTWHPVLKMVDQEIKMLELRKKIASGSYLPQVNSFAELHYGKPGIDFFKNQWSFYFQGGINVNLRVFDWNQLKRDKNIVDMSIEKLNNRKEELIAEVKKKLTQLYAKMLSLQKQLEMAKKLVSFASEDAGLKEELYKEQQLANVDLLSALLDKERYESLENELTLQIQLVKLNINTLIGRYGDEQ